MPDGLITSRPLQNEATGIDLQVPQYQEIRGPMMTGHVEYQIVVVTRLAAFKSAKHKPGDVVQLVVSKKYSEIDEFYYSLIARYPNIHLPAMPRKALFVGESDIRERRAAFDEFMRFVSKHQTLATCPELLEFLGAKCTAPDVKTTNIPDCLVEEEDDDGLDFFSKDEPSSIRPRELKKPMKVEKPPVEQEEEEEEEELFDPLGGMRSKKPKPAKPAAKPPPKPKLSLFDEEHDPDEELFQPAPKANPKLFEDPDLGGTVFVGDPLLLPNACQQSAESGPKVDEDVDDLFRVEEDLDKLLAISKPVRPKPVIAPKPKPAVKPKPVVPQKPSSLNQTGRASSKQGSAQDMDQLDILKYIQQNESAVSEDLDLF